MAALVLYGRCGLAAERDHSCRHPLFSRLDCLPHPCAGWRRRLHWPSCSTRLVRRGPVPRRAVGETTDLAPNQRQRLLLVQHTTRGGAGR